MAVWGLTVPTHGAHPLSKVSCYDGLKEFHASRDHCTGGTGWVTKATLQLTWATPPRECYLGFSGRPPHCAQPPDPMSCLAPVSPTGPVADSDPSKQDEVTPARSTLCFSMSERTGDTIGFVLMDFTSQCHLCHHTFCCDPSVG